VFGGALLAVAFAAAACSKKPDRPVVRLGAPAGNAVAETEATKAIDAFIAARNVDKSRPDWREHLVRPEKATFAPGVAYLWKLATNKGDLRIRLDAESAPMHVTNTIYLTKLGFYDGLTFHRVIPGFMAQGGDPKGTGEGGPGYQFGGEISRAVKHDRAGTLSAAHAGPGTDGSQFFITFGSAPHLDGKHTVYGYVIEGTETLPALEDCGSRKGDTDERLVIEKATIELVEEPKP
jgi:cyclophilin family peptidyl-prolyl cis-trans isomerase